MPRSGIHTVTAPGAVAGWEALRARLGTRPMSELLAPAIVYAEAGFPVSDVIAAHWSALTAKLAAEPNAAATYLPIVARHAAARSSGTSTSQPRSVASQSTAGQDSTGAQRRTRSSRSRARRAGR